MLIYCVEDDPGIRDLTVYTLRSVGFEAQGLENGAQLWAALETPPLPDLILLDIMLPGGQDGMELLRRLRRRLDARALPVIMATAKGAEYDKVQALDDGADDYLVKPYGMMELVSRVRAVLRRAQGGSRASLTLGAITLDPGSHRVTVSGREVALTLKEFRLLQCFLTQPGQVLTRDALLDAVWGYEFDGETRTVDAHIHTLRQKVGEEHLNIVTVRGVGYRLEETQ